MVARRGGGEEACVVGWRGRGGGVKGRKVLEHVSVWQAMRGTEIAMVHVTCGTGIAYGFRVHGY
eukprot:3930089-Rhodomonas_salina.1